MVVLVVHNSMPGIENGILELHNSMQGIIIQVFFNRVVLGQLVLSSYIKMASIPNFDFISVIKVSKIVKKTGLETLVFYFISVIKVSKTLKNTGLEPWFSYQ